MTLPRFYPIFDNADWLERMLPLGVKLAQLRVKDRAGDDTSAEIRRGIALARHHGAALVINDYWQIAIDEGADWLHLGQEDLETADIPAIRRAGIRLGISTHDHAELDRALALAPDYVALGPIYPTRLKQMAFGPQGLARITEWKALVGGIPLCAIGGMTVERAPGAFAAGADIVSVVTDITLNPAPEDRLRQWLGACG
ncbi:thiamine-phosphate pyrophosphorylase [Rhodobacteraceae bacterium MBR-64]|jgi:thiamine-phosphate pyrophosphorylase